MSVSIAFIEGYALLIAPSSVLCAGGMISVLTVVPMTAWNQVNVQVYLPMQGFFFFKFL